MSTKKLIAQAQAERWQDQTPVLQCIEDIRALERLVATIKDTAQQEVLSQTILERKRILKGRIEANEKEADNLDKASLPVAGFLIAAGAWLTSPRWSFLPQYTMHIEVISGLAGALAWSWLRWLYVRRSKAARVALARLGKVE